MDDLPPELEDFSQKFEHIRRPKNSEYIGDYTQPVEEKVYKAPVEKPEKSSNMGLKKGFFSSEPKSSQKQEKIHELKINPKQCLFFKKENRLEIPEVQEAMKMNDYLTKNKNEWQTPDFMERIAKNPKIQKLFTNQEYQRVNIFMQAIGMMQKEPKKAMELYGNNKEFMDIFKEFCKEMGQNFENLAQKQKEENQDPVEYIIQNDPEVKAILADQKVQAFIEYLQKNQKVDFHEIMAKDKYLAPKLKVLIDKKVLNIQRQ